VYTVLSRSEKLYTKYNTDFYIWSTLLYGAETWTLREVEERCVGSFEMWYSRRVEKIIWNDLLRNYVVLYAAKAGGILHTIKTEKVIWIVHIFLSVKHILFIFSS